MRLKDPQCVTDTALAIGQGGGRDPVGPCGDTRVAQESQEERE